MISHVADRANAEVEILGRKAAEGNEQAIRDLIFLGWNVTSYLETARRSHPAVLDRAVRGHEGYPMWLPIRKAERDKFLKEILALPIADDHPLAIRAKKSWDPALPANKAAQNVWATIHWTRECQFPVGIVEGKSINQGFVDGDVGDRIYEVSMSLPEFTKATAPKWWKAGREIFILIYGEKFEEHPELQGISKSRCTSKEGKRLAGDGRDDILKAVGQAFKTIARDSPK